MEVLKRCSALPASLREQKIYEGSFKMMKNKTQNLLSIFF